jgi:hypothetical protein
MESHEWNPKPKLSDTRILEIRSCGVYLLSKAEKEALIEEVLSARQTIIQPGQSLEPS